MATTIIAGNTYTFKNLYSGKMLNLYGGYTTNGTNVCQYTADGSDEQKWTFGSDNKLYTYGSSTKCLDRYNNSGSLQHNNADIWTNNDDANQKIIVSPITNSYVTIKIAGTALFLTAYHGTANGGNTDNRIAPGATGNVFWATSSDENVVEPAQQKWIMTLVEDSSSGTVTKDYTNVTKQYLVPPYPVSAVTADYDEDCEMIKAAKEAGHVVCSQYPYAFHWGVDFAGRNASDNTAVLRNIKSSGYGVVIRISYYNYLGNAVLVKYPNAAYGTSGIYKRDIYFLYCHLESIAVSEGQAVTPETKIGVAGQTGAGANANHLHLEAFTQDCESPSAGGTTDYCVDPIDYFFNSTEEDSVGLRNLVPDSAAPLYRSEYCPGGATNSNGFTCIHTNNLYYYNTAKIYGIGNFGEAVFN